MCLLYCNSVLCIRGTFKCFCQRNKLIKKNKYSSLSHQYTHPCEAAIFPSFCKRLQTDSLNRNRRSIQCLFSPSIKCTSIIGDESRSFKVPEKSSWRYMWQMSCGMCIVLRSNGHSGIWASDSVDAALSQDVKWNCGWHNDGFLARPAQSWTTSTWCSLHMACCTFLCMSLYFILLLHTGGEVSNFYTT